MPGGCGERRRRGRLTMCGKLQYKWLTGDTPAVPGKWRLASLNGWGRTAEGRKMLG